MSPDIPPTDPVENLKKLFDKILKQLLQYFPFGIAIIFAIFLFILAVLFILFSNIV